MYLQQVLQISKVTEGESCLVLQPQRYYRIEKDHANFQCRPEMILGDVAANQCKNNLDHSLDTILKHYGGATISVNLRLLVKSILRPNLNFTKVRQRQPLKESRLGCKKVQAKMLHTKCKGLFLDGFLGSEWGLNSCCFNSTLKSCVFRSLLLSTH